MDVWELPEYAELNGVSYKIHSDFRDVLEIIGVLEDVDRPESIRVLVGLSLFYDDLDVTEVSQNQLIDAVNWMCGFIGLFEENTNTATHKQIDWEQDQRIIISEINKVAGKEIRLESHLHWWTFISYFSAIGEGQLSYIVNIREKLRKGQKLEKHEREYYRNNRERVELKVKLSKQEQELLDKWMLK